MGIGQLLGNSRPAKEEIRQNLSALSMDPLPWAKGITMGWVGIEEPFIIKEGWTPRKDSHLLRKDTGLIHWIKE